MAIAIIVAIFIIIIAYIILKPYFIKYNTTLLFTGEMGSGKTLNAVKTAVKVYKKNLFTVRLHNWFTKIKNKHIKLIGRKFRIEQVTQIVGFKPDTAAVQS